VLGDLLRGVPQVLVDQVAVEAHRHRGGSVPRMRWRTCRPKASGRPQLAGRGSLSFRLSHDAVPLAGHQRQHGTLRGIFGS
jgi:hypothetical protein